MLVILSTKDRPFTPPTTPPQRVGEPLKFFLKISLPAFFCRNQFGVYWRWMLLLSYGQNIVDTRTMAPTKKSGNIHKWMQHLVYLDYRHLLDVCLTCLAPFDCST